IRRRDASGQCRPSPSCHCAEVGDQSACALKHPATIILRTSGDELSPVGAACRVRGGMGIVKERFSEGHPMKKICFRITLALTVLTMTEHVAARPHAAQGTLLWQPTVTASGAGFTNSVAVDNQGNGV